MRKTEFLPGILLELLERAKYELCRAFLLTNFI